MRYLLLSVLLLSSCTVYLPYTVRSYTSTNNDNPSQLTDIPLSPHNKPIEVFFGDEKPKETYIKAFIMEEGAYGDVAYGTLVNRLKRQGQDKGVDAIIILSKDRNVTETEFSYTVTNTVSALGIKYVKNLKFEENIPRQAILSVFDEQKAIYVPKENFLLNRKMQVKYFNQSNIYLNNFHYYSLDYMLYEINENWFVRLKEGTNQIYERQYRGLKNMTFTFSYDSQGRVVHVLRHHYLSDKPVDIEIEFEYNKGGKLSKSKIYQKAGLRELVLDKDGNKIKRFHKRTEVFEYHSDGKPLRRTIFQIRDGKPKPLMKLSYEFYTKEAYQELVENVPKTTL